jgi:hypothetical protein
MLKMLPAFAPQKSFLCGRAIPDVRYVADRNRHRRCFDGRLWFSDLSAEQLNKIKSVADHCSLQEKFLSRGIKEETVATGSREFDQSTSLLLQGKAKYIVL